ncbi:GatB/YqeY domain-containing protein [Candidatus Binatia bacterium]|jgi:uncharacterized protein YqeY|nr:GatB/YqeY domain-containing protein [Candidatus Binatia bacterium]
MSIEQDLDQQLKQALRDKDQPTLDVVRMIKSKVQERRTAKGFSGSVDDALLRDVIGAYKKQLQKAVEEYEKIGERGVEQISKLRFEIEFASRFLPATMGDAELRVIVAERIAALGVSDAKQVGKLVGDVMKTHRGQVEAADVKRIAEALLAGG